MHRFIIAGIVVAGNDLIAIRIRTITVGRGIHYSGQPVLCYGSWVGSVISHESSGQNSLSHLSPFTVSLNAGGVKRSSSAMQASSGQNTFSHRSFFLSAI
jgi:hypothetical protein